MGVEDDADGGLDRDEGGFWREGLIFGGRRVNMG